MIWIYGILCLIFLVIFHEIGHFIAARICGVKVESFSVGFGPILLHKTIKGTDYRLSLIPLGGYCGLKGEKDFQKALEQNLNQMEAEKDSLYGVSPLKRGFIAFNGPFFNFILAIILYTFINLIGYSYSTYSNKIIIPDQSQTDIISIARDSGILTGDKIIKVNNKDTNTFEELRQEIALKGNEELTLTINRNGTILTINLTPHLDKKTGIGQIGILADQDSLITIHTPKYNFFTAIGAGTKDCFNSIKLTYKSIGILFKGVELKNTISGPVRTTQFLGSTIKNGFAIDGKTGFLSLFELVSIISISLAIFNLLPIPILDGGTVFTSLIELIIRKKIKPKILYYIQFIGLAFIVVIFCIGMFTDISYFINK